MSSKTGVISTKSMLLSQDDPRVEAMKFEQGDKFLLKVSALESSGWEWDMSEELKGHTVIIEITSYEIDMEGDLGYRCHFITPSYDWHWWIPEDMLESDFVYLGKHANNSRFVLLDE